MKNLMEGFKTYIGEDQEKQPENKVFKVGAVLRLNKIGGVDITDVLNKCSCTTHKQQLEGRRSSQCECKIY